MDQEIFIEVVEAELKRLDIELILLFAPVIGGWNNEIQWRFKADESLPRPEFQDCRRISYVNGNLCLWVLFEPEVGRLEISLADPECFQKIAAAVKNKIIKPRD